MTPLPQSSTKAETVSKKAKLDPFFCFKSFRVQHTGVTIFGVYLEITFWLETQNECRESLLALAQNKKGGN